MHFYFPRRHRRHLLFPPGLLALAGLLWLGCVAVRSWQEQLKPRYVIRFTMPTRPPANWPQPTIRWVIPSPDTLLQQGSWHEATLTGNDANDSFQQQHIIEELRAIIADTLHTGGLRVRLEPTARYASMVFLLDLMLRKDVKQYWFDIIRKSTTFYAITPIRMRSDPIGMICGDRYFNLPRQALPFGVRFDNWVTNFWSLAKLQAWLQPLRQPEWRASVWLLAAVGAVGSWRIIQTWRMA